MIKARKIELLAPARDAECGIEAIKHGADAVYIGAPKFSARSAAGNSVNDIKQLAEYAHLFGAKVYVALNTILTDRELTEAERLIWELYEEAKIDAFIIQDMGILKLNLPPIALHASTQTDNRNLEKVKFLEQTGFRQIVLARELGIEQIRQITSEVKIPIEVFVHGALCVSYSGQCYISQALSGRSANKGSCAQYCRLPYTLTDAEGKEIVSKKHLLSMKDLNLSDNLEELLDAGVSSLKIEGRLKDKSYVKNVVAYYRLKLDEILSRRPEFLRSSAGHSIYTFTPDLRKSFNRGFTKYFLYGRTNPVWSLDTPKSIGEPLGKITEITTRFIKIETKKTIANGDGLCFINANKELEGIHVNKVEGDFIFPALIPKLKKGTFIYRNFDHNFEKLLSKNSAERKIDATIILREVSFGFSLEIRDEEDNAAIVNFEYKKELAQKVQSENIRYNLMKTGNTIFSIQRIDIEWSNEWFIPASVLSEWRRLLVDRLMTMRKINFKQEIVKLEETKHPFPLAKITYLGNVMNEKSRNFFAEHHSRVLEPAFEKQSVKNATLMFAKHCIKYSLGWCPKGSSTAQFAQPYREPFFLKYDTMKLRVVFDCKKCEMQILDCRE